MIKGLFKLVMWIAVVSASATYLLTVYAPELVETIQKIIGGK